MKKTADIDMQKNKGDFRNYDTSDTTQSQVTLTYKLGRRGQTHDFVQDRIREFESREKTPMKIWDAMDALDNFVDKSDPDITIPNLYHLFQTAEAMRKDRLPDWMQLTGLIHDLGKIMYIWGNDHTGTSVKSQWAIVGDTFITGCEFPTSLVHSEFNTLNPDMTLERFNTKYGIYTPNTGLQNCFCSWGHDEFMYRVLKHNNTKLPEEALYIIRYHSLYAWHTEGEYKHLMDNYDHQMLSKVQEFNKYDLYTKAEISKEDLPHYYASLKPYYEDLISKYLGDVLYF
jgi:inositol oxygenase